jgi:hypothetical protein
MLASSFLSRLTFDPEDGDYTFLRNVGSYTEHMALYLRRWLKKKLKLNSVALVRERTIPNEGQQFVGEFSAKFCG